MNMIFHITPQADWDAARAAGVYRADSLEKDGFIHCSTGQQILMVANSLYRGCQNLALLCIDPAAVGPDIVYEDCYEMGQEFPHIYGPLNIDAVVRILDFPPGEDGTFVLPSGIIE
ncbi:MAG: DUF952 domain-containing protein [Anaerolineae bacterium]